MDQPEAKVADEVDPRLVWAAEQVLLAWIRTGLALMGFGFVVARFGLFLRGLEVAARLPHQPTISTSLWIGDAFLVIGVVVNVYAGVSHQRFLNRLRRGEPYQLARWTMGIGVAVLLAILGVGMLAYLLKVEQ